MKRIFSVFLTLAMLAGVFVLSGCKSKDVDLSDALHLQYDKAVAKLEDKTLESKKGNWRIVIHACTSKKDLQSRKTYFENTVKSIANLSYLGRKICRQLFYSA